MRTRLSDAQIRLVRALLSAENPKLPYAKIAERVGVSAALIGQIARDEIACYRNVGIDSQDESLDEFLDALGYDDEPEVVIEAPLAVGEVVRLKSGSPDMTVERTTAYSPETLHPYVTVSYWTDDGVTSARLHPDTVERVA